MDIMVFGILLFVFQGLYWFIGKRASRNLKNKEEYFLAGKSVRFFPLMMTFFATIAGGGLILGSSGEAFQFGWSVLFYPLGVSLGLIFLGSGIGRRLAQFQISTIAQLFEVVYHSPFLNQLASIILILSLFMVLVAQIICSNKFLIAIGLSNPLLFIVFWVIIILYTVRGGLKAVISTDIAQAVVIILIFFLCAMFILSSGYLSAWTPSFGTFALSTSKLTGWLFMPALFIIIAQDMGQRCFAGETPRTVSKAASCAGVCTFAVSLVPIFLGVLGKNLGIEIPPKASVLMTVVAHTTSPWITALMGCAILAAIISTATSLINAISSNLSQDFPFFKQENLRPIRLATLIISLTAIFFAFFLNDVIKVLIQSYELSVSCLFVPIFISLFKKEEEFLSGLLSIAFGSAAFCFFKFVSLPFLSEIVEILISFLGYCIGELIAKSRRKAIATLE